MDDEPRGKHLLYRDLVPYEAPASLDALRGPALGMVELPITVYWGPRAVFDLENVGERRMAYRALVREGTLEVQEALLNADLVRATWPDLVLPDRCRRLWEERFPELAQSKEPH